MPHCLFQFPVDPEPCRIEIKERRTAGAGGDGKKLPVEAIQPRLIGVIFHGMQQRDQKVLPRAVFVGVAQDLFHFVDSIGF